MSSTWTDIAAITMPPRIAALAQDSRGYPIPYTVQRDKNGLPDFRVIDPQRWMRAAESKRCGICGDPLGTRVAMVGGPMSMANHLFTDLPMHKDCAEFSLQACPFLAAPKFAYSRKIEGLDVNDMVSPNRPEKFGLGITKGVRLVRLPNGELALQAAPFESITWWAGGRLCRG